MYQTYDRGKAVENVETNTESKKTKITNNKKYGGTHAIA